MISILIPIYNHCVVDLIHSLHYQALTLNIPFEIIAIDDCSEEKTKQSNNSIKSMQYVKYEELKINAGRSKIRNLLAEKACYSYLLFIDCDATMYKEDYISSFIKECRKNIVVCGGTMYIKGENHKNKQLRLKYGFKREMNSAKKRNCHSFDMFSAFNFLIDRDLFLNIKFNESIQKYGHEDTLFGLQLEKQKIQIKHIDNQLIHSGIYTNLEFIMKTKQGIENLYYLYLNNTVIAEYSNRISLLKYFKILQNLCVVRIVAYLFKKTEVRLEHFLINKTPNLLIFDCFKIGYLCYYAKYLFHQD